MNFNESFALTQPVDPATRPVNTLAIPAPCKDAADFDFKYLKKLIREVVIFRDADGNVERPLPDDTVVEGSWQHRAFAEAKIDVPTVTAKSLLDDGFKNDFLLLLAPDWSPPAPATSETQKEGARTATADVQNGRASAKPKPENWRERDHVGRGAPASGGMKVV